MRKYSLNANESSKGGIEEQEKNVKHRKYQV